MHEPSPVKRSGAGWAAARLSTVDATTLRFLITGSSAAGLFFILSFGAVRIGLPAFAGTLLAYGTTFVISYTVQHSWTFRGRNRHREALPRYLTVQIGCGLISATLAHGLDLLACPPLPMAATTTVAASAVSFVLSKHWAFAA